MQFLDFQIESDLALAVYTIMMFNLFRSRIQDTLVTVSCYAHERWCLFYYCLITASQVFRTEYKL